MAALAGHTSTRTLIEIIAARALEHFHGTTPQISTVPSGLCQQVGVRHIVESLSQLHHCASGFIGCAIAKPYPLHTCSGDSRSERSDEGLRAWVHPLRCDWARQPVILQEACFSCAAFVNVGHTSFWRRM